MDYEDFLGSMGRVIRYERAKRGYSQERLADRAGLHRNHLGHVERGEINATIFSLLRIADALRLPISELMAKAEDLAAEEAGRED